MDTLTDLQAITSTLDIQPRDSVLRLVYSDLLEEMGELDFANVQRWLARKGKSPRRGSPYFSLHQVNQEDIESLPKEIRGNGPREYPFQEGLFATLGNGWMWYGPDYGLAGWNALPRRVYKDLQPNPYYLYYANNWKGFLTRDSAERALIPLLVFLEKE